MEKQEQVQEQQDERDVAQEITSISEKINAVIVGDIPEDRKEQLKLLDELKELQEEQLS